MNLVEFDIIFGERWKRNPKTRYYIEFQKMELRHLISYVKEQ